MPSIQSSSPTQAVAGATVALTLTGAGFVPGTVILANGVAVSTTYQSSTSVVANVPAPAGSTADVVVQARNPAPGGGTSPAVTLGVAMLELNASDVDGTNTGTARLSGGVNLATINTDAAHHTVSWSLQGAGTLTPTGNNNFGATYTPPSTMPANPTVTVTAYLTYYPVVATSYTFTLINPIPNIYFSTPQAVEGATVPLTFNGYNLVPGTTILVNGVGVPTIFVSTTSLTAQITAPPGASGNLAVQAQNPAPGGGTVRPFRFPLQRSRRQPRTQTGQIRERRGWGFR